MTYSIVGALLATMSVSFVLGVVFSRREGAKRKALVGVKIVGFFVHWALAAGFVFMITASFVGGLVAFGEAVSAGVLGDDGWVPFAVYPVLIGFVIVLAWWSWDAGNNS